MRAAGAILDELQPAAVLGGGRLRRRAGRAGRDAPRHPARADRGRQSPGPHEPAARPPCPPRLPGVRDRRARRAIATASPGGRSPRRRPTAPRARARFGLAEDDTVVLVFGGSLGARSINEAAVDGVGRAGPRLPGAPHRGRARPGGRSARASATRRPPGTTCAGSSTGSARRCSPATSSSRAPAARSSRSRPRAARRSWCPTRTPPPTIRPRTRAGWSARARRSSIDDSAVSAERLAREVVRAARRPAAPAARWRPPRRGSHGRTRRATSPASCAPPRRAASVRPMPDPRPWTGRRLHLVGIGGVGMSGYATVVRAARRDGQRLGPRGLAGARAAASRRGSTPARGTTPRSSRTATTSRSSSRARSPRDNPEVAAAHERGLRVMPRAELLGELSALRRTIAVAGAHGKTTTSSMTAHVLLGCGMDPGYLIGGELRTTGLRRRVGDGRLARRRGRRVRPLDALARRRGRRRHERRARPPRDVRVARRGARGLPRPSSTARRTP